METVCVQTLHGESAEVVVHPQSSTLDLKEQLAALWNVPPLCQRLIANMSCLGDEELVEAIPTAEGDQKSVMMIVSVEGVLRKLHGNVSRQEGQDALVALAKLGCRQAGNGNADLLIHRFFRAPLDQSDGQDDLFNSFGQVLAIGLEGFESSVDVFMALLEVQDCRLRCVAVEALAAMKPIPHDSVLYALLTRLEDINEHVRNRTRGVIHRLMGNGIVFVEWPHWLVHHKHKFEKKQKTNLRRSS